MSYIIRLFAPADLPAVLRLEQRCFDDEAWSSDEFAWMYYDGPDLFCVAEINQRLIGYICGVVDDGEGYIGSIGVDPDVRRLGLGKALFDTFRKRAVARGAAAITLHVRPDNAPALALYRKLGFTVAAVVPDYYGEAQPGLYMRLAL
ncbi:MAG: ribosomal protein S18-alanine N-acetyltransferase [Anaerolineae bacterium]|nr:ribosomal protein S18-alanine N-acetyltransferase [Anaerolineae bacterium]